MGQRAHVRTDAQIFRDQIPGSHQDLAAVDDGVQAVCHGDAGAAVEFVVDGRLDEGVRLHVDVGGGLVQHQHAAAPQQGSREGDELALALREGRTVVHEAHIEALRMRCDSLCIATAPSAPALTPAVAHHHQGAVPWMVVPRA